MMFLQCKFIYTILNIVLQSVLYPVLYLTISFVHIQSLYYCMCTKKGPLQISTMY